EALGFRVHSGWAVVVAVSGPLTSPTVTERWRIEFAAPEIPGSTQPYHAAEGEFFRNVVMEACKHHEVQVIGVKEKELLPHFENELHISPAALDQHLSSIGRAMGPPWRQDQRFATMVAWLAAAGRTSN